MNTYRIAHIVREHVKMQCNEIVYIYECAYINTHTHTYTHTHSTVTNSSVVISNAHKSTPGNMGWWDAWLGLFQEEGMETIYVCVYFLGVKRNAAHGICLQDRIGLEGQLCVCMTRTCVYYSCLQSAWLPVFQCILNPGREGKRTHPPTTLRSPPPPPPPLPPISLRTFCLFDIT